MGYYRQCQSLLWLCHLSVHSMLVAVYHVLPAFVFSFKTENGNQNSVKKMKREEAEKVEESKTIELLEGMWEASLCLLLMW